MDLLAAIQQIPLRQDEDGVIRVGQTRVPLDTVVIAFQEGASAEEIAQQYPTLQLADVYGAIAFILRNPQAVDAYLHRRRQQAAEIAERCADIQMPAGLRDRLLARRAAKPGT